MRFHCALGHVQIASDFRIVTPLEQQLDDLPLSGSYLVELLFHKSLHLTDAAPVTASGAETKPPSAHLNSGRCVSFCNHAAKSCAKALTKCENFVHASFAGKITVTAVIAGRCGQKS
jgi:hypothetical protein